MKNEKTKIDYIQNDMDTIFNMSNELEKHFYNRSSDLWNEDVKKDLKKSFDDFKLNFMLEWVKLLDKHSEEKRLTI